MFLVINRIVFIMVWFPFALHMHICMYLYLFKMCNGKWHTPERWFICALVINVLITSADAIVYFAYPLSIWCPNINYIDDVLKYWKPSSHIQSMWIYSSNENVDSRKQRFPQRHHLHFNGSSHAFFFLVCFLLTTCIWWRRRASAVAMRRAHWPKCTRMSCRFSTTEIRIYDQKRIRNVYGFCRESIHERQHQHRHRYHRCMILVPYVIHFLIHFNASDDT